MRILYVAGNRDGSFHQLQRYLPEFKQSKHQCKIAAYKKSIGDLNCDYCLDSLLNFTNAKQTISFNGNYSYYSQEIKKFAPDLVISDFDIHSSILAIEQNIPLWQVSPMLLYYALPYKTKYSLCLHKHHSYLISAERGRHQYIKNILNNSNKKLVLSHICDSENRPELLPGFEWLRPEFKLEEENIITNLTDAFYNEKDFTRFFNDAEGSNDIERLVSSYTNNFFLSKNTNIKLDENIKFLMELL